MRSIQSIRQQLAAPPSDDMGARTQATAEGDARPVVLVDWLEVTLPDGADPRAILPGWGELGWVDLKGGRLGYRQAVQCGAIRVDFDGVDGMGVHVTLSGRGCREAEALGLVTGPAFNSVQPRLGYTGAFETVSQQEAGDAAPDWPAFARRLIAAGAKATRIDLALDDHAGHLDLERMHRAWQAGHVSTRWKECDPRMPSERGRPAELQTLYFGAPKSEGRLRVYNKAHEQGLPAGVPWNRAELQLRRDRAQRALTALAERPAEKVGELVAGLMKAYIRFVVLTASRLENCPTVDWWAAFLGAVAAVRLGARPQLASPVAARACLEHQWAPWAATITAFYGGDLTWLTELVYRGRDRMSDRQRAILAAVA